MAFAIHVSLIPFRLRGMPLGLALDQFADLMTSPAVGRLSRTNFLANLLLFLPVGFGLAGARLADRTRSTAASLAALAVALPLSIMVSLTAEFLQMFAPGRVPSRADVEAQTVGCIAGMAGWLMVGRPLTTWLRSAQMRGGGRLVKALAAYAVIWTVVGLAPFDVTFDLGELSQRVRSGMITFTLFGGGRPVSRLAWDALITAISAVPLGMLGLTAARSGRRRDPRLAFAIGAAFVLILEGAQVFIASHAADVTDALFGCLGVAIGVAAGMRVWPERRPTHAPVARYSQRRWTATLSAVWCMVLLIYHWMPYDFRVDPAMIRTKLAAMSLVPFAGYAHGSDLNALSDLLVKIGLSVPLGVIGAFVVRPRERTAVTTATSLAAATVVFAVIEAGQLFIPSRSPDPGDVLVGVAGAAVGLWLGQWLQTDP